MDFGVLSHREASPNAALKDSTEHTNGNANGSGNLKEKRSKLAEDSLRVTKMQRQFHFEIPNQKTENLIAFGRSSLLLSEGDEGQKMLSFSSSEPHGQSENYSSARGGSNEGIRGGCARLKGPFTPYQWMELERHALIYKHILANVPIPSNLTAPLRTPYASSGSYSSNLLGWGPFHQGFSGSNDPEPGRCRRTDGKKWRCSRDAVPDQKYCERHINRGRHRSRKPVEGQSGHALSGSVTSAVAPTASSSSKTLADMQPKRNFLQPSTLNLANRNQGFQDLSASLSIHKQNVPFEEPSNSEFGIVYTEALVNPSQRMPCLNTKDTSPFSNFNNQETNNQYPACHFIDDNPKELKSDWTQLSMSIPATHSEFSSSSYPSLTMSTERPSIELDPIQMSLGVGNDDVSESVQKQLDWLPPVSWGSSMGSPLGEVLTRTAMGTSSSSPDGVLQKSTIFSLSNSSWGSGDSADKRLPEDASCQGGLVSAITSL